MATPDGMNAKASTFTLRPIVTPRWISTNEAILQPSPIAQPYRLTCSGGWITTLAPRRTSGAITADRSVGPDRDARRLAARLDGRGRARRPRQPPGQRGRRVRGAADEARDGTEAEG